MVNWKPLSEQEIQSIIGITKEVNIGCRSCNSKIGSLAPVCPGMNKNIGDIVHMSATPVGGTAPYTVSFKKGVGTSAILLKQFTGVTEAQIVTYDYTILSADAGATSVFSDNTIDSCSVGAKSCNEQCSITVNPLLVTSTITMVSPNGGEIWTQGSTYNITWLGTDIYPHPKIELFKGGIFNRQIVNSSPTINTYSWTVPIDLAIGNDYKIKITACAGTDTGCNPIRVYITDMSNNNFSISAPVPICNSPVCNLVVT